MSVNKSGFIWRKEMTVPFWNYNFQILHLLIALIKFLIVKSMDQKTRLFKSLADIWDYTLKKGYQSKHLKHTNPEYDKLLNISQIDRWKMECYFNLNCVRITDQSEHIMYLSVFYVSFCIVKYIFWLGYINTSM